jgi:hypothetical protein
MPRPEAEAGGADPARATQGEPPGAFARNAERALFALLGLLTAVLLAQLLQYGYGRDQAIYSLVADAMLRGDAPYRDVWDFKPPGVYAVYAFARSLFGGGFIAVRVLETLALLSLFPAFAILSRRHVGSARAGLLAAAVATFAYVPIEFWYTAQPEGFGGVLLAWALVCATYEPTPADGAAGVRRQRLAWAGAAALYASAALLKPPLGGGILVSFAFVIARRARAAEGVATARTLAAPTLAFALGGALPIAATLAYFAALGALDELQRALFVFAPGYTAIGLADGSPWALLGRTLREWLLLTAPFNLVGLVALALLPPLGPGERRGAAHVLGVIAFSLIGVGLQAKFFVYHYAATLILTGLLAGWGIWKLWNRARHAAWSAALFAAALGALAFGVVPGLPDQRSFWTRTAMRFEALAVPALQTPYRDRLYSLGDVDAGRNRRAAEWLMDRTPADAPLFVWGFEPVIYSISGRSPASRYIYNVPQRTEWAQAESRRELMADLTATPPEAIVVVQRDSLPWVTGSPLDSAAALATFPELAQLLEREYRSAQHFGDLRILLRRDPADGAPAAGSDAR